MAVGRLVGDDFRRHTVGRPGLLSGQSGAEEQAGGKKRENGQLWRQAAGWSGRLHLRSRTLGRRVGHNERRSAAREFDTKFIACAGACG